MSNSTPPVFIMGRCSEVRRQACSRVGKLFFEDAKAELDCVQIRIAETTQKPSLPIRSAVRFADMISSFPAPINPEQCRSCQPGHTNL